MASRWMQGMKQRQRQHQRRLANSATTLTERKFEKRKVKLNSNGVIIGVESIEDHIDRMRSSAQSERIQPKEWRRVYARLQQVPSIQSLRLNGDERLIIRNKFYRESVKHRTYASSEVIESSIGDIKLLPTETISSVEQAILRYRRLVRYPEEKRLAKERAEALRVKLEAIKGKR
jgi:hypothetical protein